MPSAATTSPTCWRSSARPRPRNSPESLHDAKLPGGGWSGQSPAGFTKSVSFIAKVAFVISKTPRPQEEPFPCARDGRRLPACMNAVSPAAAGLPAAPVRGTEGTGSVEEEVVRHRLVRVLLAVMMLLGGALSTSVLAQGLTGQITGTVTDSGGGVMPGATVSLKNAGTNQAREAITGADGAFQ